MSEHDDLRYHRPSSALAPVLEMYSGFMLHELLSTLARRYIDSLAPRAACHWQKCIWPTMFEGV